jgi:hypothetical protein
MLRKGEVFVATPYVLKIILIIMSMRVSFADPLEHRRTVVGTILGRGPVF